MSRESTLGHAVRGALIAYGIAFFSWWFARTLPADEDDPWALGNIYMIALGLALQLVAWIVKRVIARSARGHATPAAPPAVVGVVQIVIDGVTVLLFAIATFRSIAIAPSSL